MLENARIAKKKALQMLENARKKCYIWPFFLLKHKATFGRRSNFWPIF